MKIKVEKKLILDQAEISMLSAYLHFIEANYEIEGVDVVEDDSPIDPIELEAFIEELRETICE